MKILCLLLLVSISSTAYAQSSSRFAITRSVMAGGGTTFSSSSRFQLGGTAAQPLAAVPGSARYSIQGGFWIWPAPVLFAPGKAGTNFVFSFQTEPGKSYTVFSSDSPVGPVWQTAATISGDGTVKAVTNAVPGAARKFYRLVEQ